MTGKTLESRRSVDHDESPKGGRLLPLPAVADNDRYCDGFRMPAIHVLACAGAGARKPPGNEPARWRLGFRQTLALSTAYQAGVVAWVVFWAFYGRGFTAENAMAITTFGGAYMLVVIVEPLTDLRSWQSPRHCIR